MTAIAGSRVDVPDGFLWGVATAAFQVEGSSSADGRGASIWDTFCREPGHVVGGDTGDVACDHYRRYRDDVRLLSGLGVDAYRFSVAWPRVQPDGRGRANAAGLDFYERLVDELLDVDIRPCLTLYHWDLPQALEDEGGWRVRTTAERFADYAVLVHDRLGDRVRYWFTLNEPFCSAFAGYAQGRHAPGAREGHGALAAAHHLLLGHGLAVQGLRARRRTDEQLGVVLSLNAVSPASSSEEDAAAARRADCAQNLAFTDPLLAGRYPEAEQETWPGLSDFSFRQSGDLDVIRAPLDVLGVNTYYPQYAAAAPHEVGDDGARTAADIGVVDAPPASLPRTSMGWPVEPDAMRRVLVGLHRRYPGAPPLMVTENGASFPDVTRHDGSVPDPDRIAYLAGNLRAVQEALAEGVDVRGYFCWSFLDNFEWAHGYGQRFGLVHVDYPTQVRTPKWSYWWYRATIAASTGAARAGREGRPASLGTVRGSAPSSSGPREQHPMVGREA